MLNRTGNRLKQIQSQFYWKFIHRVGVFCLKEQRMQGNNFKCFWCLSVGVAV